MSPSASSQPKNPRKTASAHHACIYDSDGLRKTVPRIVGSDSERHQQIEDIARDADSDNGECASADLWHEFPNRT